MKYPPAGIMTNVPLAFFADNTNRWPAHATTPGRRMIFYRDWYLSQTNTNDIIFYHFISIVPVHDIVDVVICFGGKMQLKCKCTFLKNEPLMLQTYNHPEPRNWMITTGPVIQAPRGQLIRGFRGFRYLKQIPF